MMRTLLAALLLCAPASAQFVPDAVASPTGDPRVTHIVTPTYEVLPAGTIRQRVTIPEGVTAAQGERIPQWTGDLVLIELRGFPAGSTWQDYTIHVDHDGYHIYDWAYVENHRPNQTLYGGTVSGSSWPWIMVGGPITGWGPGGGYPIYSVGYMLDPQFFGVLQPFDGETDWHGPSGDWAGTINNTNPQLDDQTTMHGGVRMYFAECGNAGRYVETYFAFQVRRDWVHLQETGCTWDLPSPSAIGQGTRVEPWATGCGGHGWGMSYGGRIDTRASGFGMRYTIRFEPASQPLIYEPEPFPLGAALCRAPRASWGDVLRRRDELVGVTPAGTVAFRPKLPPQMERWRR